MESGQGVWVGGRSVVLERELPKYVKLAKRSLDKKNPAGTPGEVEYTHNLSTEAGGFLVGSLPI